MLFFRNCGIFVVILALVTTSGLPATGQTSGVRVATGLSAPLFGTAPRGDNNRLFFVEQGVAGTGRVRVLDLNTQSISTFLTVTGLTTGGERGLLGLAFDPDYAKNGYFYTYSSHASFVGGNHQSEVRRWSVLGDPATSNQADASSASLLLSFTQPFSNHNGGWISFNPTTTDPYLYIASGDGGSGGDPFNNAQDTTSNLLGKMLRIDVSGDDFPGSSTANYAIPPSNPFVGTAGDDEIWAYGLRNPWRNSFDRETGDLFIADVGQDLREEIDFQPADSPGGENYGWRVMEGFGCYDNSQTGGNPPCNDPSFTAPVYQYTHGSGAFQGFSVTGGYVYHGSVDQYEGLYFFADFGTNNIWTLDPTAANPGATVVRRNTELPTSAGSYNGIASFAEDGNGELYIVSLNNGSVHRISTTSQEAVWNGDDASAGTAGDGVTWSAANNWTRGGVVDQNFVTKDTVVFAAGSSVSTIVSNGNQSVGAMRFQAPYVITSASPATMTVLSGNITVDAGVSGQIDMNLMAETGAASIRKKGAGRLDVNGDTTQIVVMDGTLGGNGTVDIVKVRSGARVAPGLSASSNQIGQLSTDTYTQEVGSTLEIQLADGDHDQLNVNGTARLAGTLEVTNAGYVDPTVPGTVDTIAAVVATAIQGGFENVTYDGTPLPTSGGNTHVGNGLFRGVESSATEVIVYNYKALPGDADGNGLVDGNDFIIWNANKFTSGTDWLSGDFDGNGITDGSDFILWNANKFTGITLPRAVPEPAGLAACYAALAAACLGRKASRAA